MTILVEDGSQVAGANSYATEADLETWADDRGVTLTNDPAALLIRAMDYLQRYAGMWKGERVSSTQDLAWPRSGAYIHGYLQASDDIPRELIYAQLALALAADSTDLMPTRSPSDKGAVIKEKVDVLEVGYANPGKVLPVAADATADALIKELLRNSGLRVVRA